MENNISFKIYDTLTDECAYIRRKVFVEEQGFKNEFDEIDKKAIHIIVYINNVPTGTGRMFRGRSDGEYIIGRVAVLKEYRGHNIGTIIISRLEEKAIILGAKKISLSAQCRVKDFYCKMGFKSIGNIYYDEDCEHICMEKIL